MKPTTGDVERRDFLRALTTVPLPCPYAPRAQSQQAGGAARAFIDMHHLTAMRNHTRELTTDDLLKWMD